jgi:hypothetical protein
MHSPASQFIDFGSTIEMPTLYFLVLPSLGTAARAHRRQLFTLGMVKGFVDDSRQLGILGRVRLAGI